MPLSLVILENWIDIQKMKRDWQKGLTLSTSYRPLPIRIVWTSVIWCVPFLKVCIVTYVSKENYDEIWPITALYYLRKG